MKNTYVHSEADKIKGLINFLKTPDLFYHTWIDHRGIIVSEIGMTGSQTEQICSSNRKSWAARWSAELDVQGGMLKSQAYDEPELEESADVLWHHNVWVHRKGTVHKACPLLDPAGLRIL